MLQTGQDSRDRATPGGGSPDVRDRQHWPKAIVGYAVDYVPGHSTGWHHHDRDQLVHGERGVMTVRTDDGAWIVPPGYAVWVPAGVVHEVRAASAVAMRTLYLRQDAGVPLGPRCRVVAVPTLVRELTARVVALPRDYPEAGPRADPSARRPGRRPAVPPRRPQDTPAAGRRPGRSGRGPDPAR